MPGLGVAVLLLLGLLLAAWQGQPPAVPRAGGALFARPEALGGPVHIRITHGLLLLLLVVVVVVVVVFLLLLVLSSLLLLLLALLALVSYSS